MLINNKRGIVEIFGFIFLVLLLFFLNSFFFQDKTCKDDTLANQCSVNKPYFCEKKILVERASVCGCSSGMTLKEDSCISDLQTEPEEISLKYILRGEEKYLSFITYNGLKDYFFDLPSSINYQNNKLGPSRQDFKLRNINEKEQKKLLLPLVVQIQNIAESKTDQVRIAVSLVQNIPFGISNKTISFGKNEINYSRYPYEVLLEMQGVCGEKSELLAFLLKELGYEVVLFYYPVENHEVVGIKCPEKYSLDKTGYCFIETTSSSIISDSKGSYFGNGKLSSIYEIIPISNGDSLGKNLYEYQDAQSWRKINNLLEKKGSLNWFRNLKFTNLKKKYGL
ncbi:MAG: hypothetical protein KJ646_05265 [Nanoarchaeota archaeon]|nr:hypothetical protein [Nanoarchaeota archaeon]